MRSVPRFALAAALLALSGASLFAPTARTAHANGPPPPVTVALLATMPGATETSLSFVDAGSAAPPSVIATFPHLPYATVRAAVVPGTSRVVVIAETLARRDRSWASELLVLAGGEAPRTLASDLARGSRPVLDGGGGVVIERGVAGPEPEGDAARTRLRVDTIAVERVDAATGATQTLYAGSGYTAHVAGVLDGEALVYRVGPGGADLVAIELATKKLRVVVPTWPPMARDFVVEPGSHSLVVQQTEPDGLRRNVLLRVDAASGQSTTLAMSGERDLVPFRWPNGLSFTPEGAGRTKVLGVGPEIALPAGGFFWGRALSPDGALALGLVMAPDALPIPIVLGLTGATTPIPSPPGARVELAGFVGGVK